MNEKILVSVVVGIVLSYLLFILIIEDNAIKEHQQETNQEITECVKKVGDLDWCLDIFNK